MFNFTQFSYFNKKQNLCEMNKFKSVLLQIAFLKGVQTFALNYTVDFRLMEFYTNSH